MTTKAMNEYYSQMTKKYLGVEAKFKQRFQLQTLEWTYYGKYSGASRFFMVFPIEYGVRYLVEIRKDPVVRNTLKKLLSEWEEAVKSNDFQRFKELLDQIFKITFENKVQIFREEMQGDVLIRKRVQAKW